MRRLLFALALAAASPAVAAEPFKTSPAAFEAHVRFLADDLLEGRAAGTRGYDIAANYVASQYAILGLKPGGANGGFFQPAPLISIARADEGAVSLRTADGKRAKLVFGKDYIPGTSLTTPDARVEAPLVFAGFGVVAPDRGRDDFAGLDVKGKIVVVLNGAPKSYQTEERAHLGSARLKRAEAAKRGAVGIVYLFTPTTNRVFGFERNLLTWRAPSMTWRTKEGGPFAPGGEIPVLATLSLTGAEKLFSGAAHTMADVMAAAEGAGDPPRFDLGARMTARIRTKLEDVSSANVAGLLEGSDPVLRNEVIVVTAHLDHIGVNPDFTGDKINNGAMDNAVGIASLLEAARGFQSGPRPKRSILFLALTAEERGLVGAEYFVKNPSVAGEIVANVNLDMPIINYMFEDIVVYGAERSNLGPIVRKAAAAFGVAMTPDPTPEQGFFTRSDHYRFVEGGIPAVYIDPGPAGEGKAKSDAFLNERYHRPGDDLAQPIDWAAGAKFADLNIAIARDIADSPERPRWNEGDFFGTLFAKK